MDWKHIKHLLKYENKIVVAEADHSPVIVLTIAEYERLLNGGQRSMRHNFAQDSDIFAASFEAERARERSEEIDGWSSLKSLNNNNLPLKNEQIRLEDLPL